MGPKTCVGETDSGNRKGESSWSESQETSIWFGQEL